MIVELIPVIELVYNNQEIESPDYSPYWKNLDEWQTYFDKCYSKAGFKDKLISYSKGFRFYRPKGITDNNLIKVIEDHMDTFKLGKTEENDLFPLYGGYVLNINNQDLLFPQCCSDLGDWVYWNSIAKKKKSVYYTGHPAPILKFDSKNVIFKCKNE